MGFFQKSTTIITDTTPVPPYFSPEEEQELQRLLKEQADDVVAKRIGFFKTMSIAAREEVIKNEELREFYNKAKYEAHSPRSDRLDELFDKAMVSRQRFNYNRLDVSDIQPYLKALPPSILVPLETLRRAHLDALADDMISKRL